MRGELFDDTKYDATVIVERMSNLIGGHYCRERACVIFLICQRL